MRKMVLMLMAVMMMISGCSSTTLIKTMPDDAKVYIDGNLVGNSPVTYSDTAVSGTVKTVTIKKDGYKEKQTVIRKEDVKTGPIIGGIFFLFPFIWTLGYPDSYTFELEPTS